MRDYQNSLQKLGIKRTQVVLLFSYGEKKLYRFDGSGQQVFMATGSAKPPSCVENSLGTPNGLHRVAEKYGDGAQPGQVFVGREDTGKHYRERDDFGPEQKTLVTTRILRLEGLEPQLNRGPGCDSLNRYIYIHGTNHPERFPDHFSAGCILLEDADLIQLYQQTPPGSHVWLDTSVSV